MSPSLVPASGALTELDPRTRFAARKAYQLFTTNPEHPSLRFKKLQGFEHVWSVRINDQFRAVGERDGDTIEWAWIGSHSELRVGSLTAGAGR